MRVHAKMARLRVGQQYNADIVANDEDSGSGGELAINQNKRQDETSNKER
jgi:hypothetical protein